MKKFLTLIFGLLLASAFVLTATGCKKSKSADDKKEDEISVEQKDNVTGNEPEPTNDEDTPSEEESPE